MGLDVFVTNDFGHILVIIEVGSDDARASFGWETTREELQNLTEIFDNLDEDIPKEVNEEFLMEEVFSDDRGGYLRIDLIGSEAGEILIRMHIQEANVLMEEETFRDSFLGEIKGFI